MSLLLVRRQLDTLPESMPILLQVLLQNELCVNLKVDFAIVYDGDCDDDVLPRMIPYQKVRSPQYQPGSGRR